METFFMKKKYMQIKVKHYIGITNKHMQMAQMSTEVIWIYVYF